MSVLLERHWRRSAAVADCFSCNFFLPWDQYSTEFPRGLLLICFSRLGLWGWCSWTDQPSCKQLSTCTCHCERRDMSALGKDFMARWGNLSRFPGPAGLPVLHISRYLSPQSWVPLCGQELGSAPCGNVWEQSMDPCAALLGPYSPSKRVFIVIAAAGEAVQWQRGSCAGMPRPCRGRAAGEGSAAPRALPATWQSPISIISRQRPAPWAAHGATRQAASRGSVLAGF